MITAAAATDHLAGQSGYTHELLAKLSDEQLVEQVASYEGKWGELTGLDRYHLGKRLRAALREQHQRP